MSTTRAERRRLRRQATAVDCPSCGVKADSWCLNKRKQAASRLCAARVDVAKDKARQGDTAPVPNDYADLGACIACLVPAGYPCRNMETGQTVSTHTSRRPRAQRCSICTLPIKADESMRGTGDGTGQSFAHDACYWRRAAEPVESTLAWVRAQMAETLADERYHGPRAGVALRARMEVLKKVQKLLGGAGG